MLRIDRILHANDFSPASITAKKYAFRLARSLEVPIDLLHVVPSIGPARFTQLDPNFLEDETSRTVFERLRRDGDPTSPLEVQYFLGRGPLPAPAIIEYSKEYDSSLIVLGAHGLRAAAENQLGSVAAELIQRSPCPVMLVPERVPANAADEKIERIVTYISFAHLVEPVLVFAFQIARMFGANLDILALTNGHSSSDSPHAIEHSSENLQKVLHRQILRAVESEAMDHGTPFEKVEVHVQGGHDPNVILQFAAKRAADLIVVEAPGLAAFESPLERMVERIVNDAPCPVIVVNTCGRWNVDMQKRGASAHAAETQ